MQTFSSSINKVYGFTNNGREGRIVDVGVDVKQCITCMVTISYAGQVLTPMYVKDGKAEKCTARINKLNIDAAVTFSESGWMTEATCLYYINNIIVPHLNGCPGCLIWDIYQPHHGPAVKQLMKEHNIEAVYVPASMTSTRQPLDTHIFGVLKKQYQKQYFEDVYFNNRKIGQLETVAMYCQLIHSIEKKLIIQAFDESMFNACQDASLFNDDPRPSHLSKKEKAIANIATDDDDECEDEESTIEHDAMTAQFADEVSDDDDDDDLEEIADAVPSYRRPRTAQITAHNQRAAQIHQDKMLRR